MNLTAQLKLQPTPEQHDLLRQTLAEANAACNWISQQAFDEKVFRPFSLHKIVYRPARERFALSAQMVVRAIAKVADAYQVSKKKQRRLRTKLQRKGTKAARRRLRKLSGKESRFAKDANHCLSKQIVAKAKDTGRAIALEDLKGISQRVTVRRSQRATLKSWSFYQLRQFIDYKAKLVGVPAVFVDPRNTSRTCPECGCLDKRNRRSQSLFSCVSCGFSGHADTIAAVNIAVRGRAVVNPPNVSNAVPPSPSLVAGGSVAPGTSSPALAGSS